LSGAFATLGRRLLLALAVFAPPVAQAADQPPEPPYTAADFARGPLLRGVQLSPDGKQFAAFMQNGKHTLLMTRAVKKGADGGPAAYKNLLATDNLEYQFNWLRWVGPERLVVSLRFPSERRLSQFHSGDSMETRLISIGTDGAEPINLGRRKNDDKTFVALDQDDVVDWLPQDGEHILLALPDARLAIEPAVFKVNLKTGSRRLVHHSRADFRSWLTDAQHRVRVGIAYKDERWTLWANDADGSNWRALRSWGRLDKDRITPLGFGLDPNLLYVLADHLGRRALFTLDLGQPEAPLQFRFKHPLDADLNGRLLHSTETGEAVGIVANVASAGPLFWDAGHKALAGGIDKALPKRANQLLQLTDADQVYLLRTAALGEPGEYMVGDRRQGTLELLSEIEPQLDPARLARKKSIHFKARDGLALQAFLSLPKDVAPKALPLVVLVHGGPQSHDTTAYDGWPAFIAARGYAVLQVNFRGSSGAGQALIEAGQKRWGLEMQDDLSDGVAELVKRGIADPQRVAIVGASYGGYAALMGVVKTPQQYRGAFAFAPLSDLVELVREVENQNTIYVSSLWQRQLGRLSSDRERLAATSPRLQADKISVPVVLIHGTLDRQAPYEHSVWMADALKAAGKDVRFISQERGDHQLSHQPYRLQFFQELDAFLLKVLGPPG
jgi:pimeloyl-ACP methyl ester carboxylesterase